MSQIPYEVVQDIESLPSEVREQSLGVPQKASGKPSVTVVQTEGATYAIVSAGEQMSGGSTISVQNVTASDCEILIHAKLEKPEPGTFTIQAISTPQVVLKLAKTEQPIRVANEKLLS